ncbi:MAG TPA: hypothetical protein DCZ40_02650 [Lachnospiraceae bacterium]|nr:hypothetical protein [Lachnospiraceae bacterium]
MKTRIKELRQERNYTQELLAVKVGANQTALSRIECGLAIPDADLIVKLSSAFHVSADYILCLSDQRLLNDNTDGKNTNIPPWFQTQLSLLQRLNPNQRIHLQHFLESIEGIY